MTDYNVNLPKTNFPMKADLAKREPQFLKMWDDVDLYTKVSGDAYKQNGKFILHDGPPYANGEIHLGHAANKILKDIILKAKMLEGQAVSYVPGWDCHGLPIELNVEKKYGRAGADSRVNSTLEFMQKCREYAGSQVELQRLAFKRLGVIGDWEKPYLTMNPVYEANIIRALGKIIENGYIGRGFKPVHWCTACGSALAEAEVEYQDRESPAIYVRFKLVNPEAFFQEKFGLKNIIHVSVPIWTTTPWTLPANEAVCLHPELEYLLIQPANSNELLIIAKDLLETATQRFGISEYRILHGFLGQALEAVRLEHPFLPKTVPIIFGEHVTAESGTGAVHTAPAHGMDDYKVGLKFKLPINNPVDAHGKFLADTEFTKQFPEFSGQNVFNANEPIITLLKERGNLIHAEKIVHSYPHCWRHKKPLIFRATPQWFVFLDVPGVTGKTLRQMAVAAIEKVKWDAPHGKERILDMVQNRPDWCISRQRTWGTPIPLIVHKISGELHPEWKKMLEMVANGVEREGIEFWHKYTLDLADYQKTTDTLDVWFDSGVSHYCCGIKAADLYLEGSDQYRGWFQSSLLTALAIDGQAPYREVISHGFTVDGDGRKMSKSLGNVILPQKITDTLGADILRLWAASLYMYDDLPVSDEILARNVDTYRLIRNTVRFLLGNLAGFDPQHDLVDLQDLLKIDYAAIFDMNEPQQTVRRLYQEYNFPFVLATINARLTDLSNFYFSIIKDRLYTMPEKSHGRRSAQTALYHILESLVRLIAPILSFTAEEIWQEMRMLWPELKRLESVFLSDYHVLKNISHPCNFDMHNIQSVARAVNKEIEKHRAAGEIGSSLEAEVVLYCDDQYLSLLKALGAELKFVLITSAAVVKPRPVSTKRSQRVSTDLPGLELTVSKSAHPKCPRCWHRCTDIGKNTTYPELCGRCAGNLGNNPEERQFA